MIHHSKFTIHNSSAKGFTLIEVLIYILFLTLFMGGSIGIAYNILKNSQDNRNKIAIEEEGNFLLKKISWVLNDVDTITYPAPNTSNTKLEVAKFGVIPHFTLDSSGGVMRLDRGPGPVSLNDSLFVVSTLSFELVSTGSINTDVLKASFYINNKKFNITKYIR